MSDDPRIPLARALVVQDARDPQDGQHGSLWARRVEFAIDVVLIAVCVAVWVAGWAVVLWALGAGR